MDGVIILLSGIWDTITVAWSWFTGLFSSEAFSNVFSALLGAVIGSISGYWFNQRLEKNRTNERYQIQRKNVIYSPIYKKLLAFEKYLTERQSGKSVLIDVEFEEKQYSYGRNTFNFHVWGEINQDIRKNYLLDTQTSAMDTLIAAVNDHETIITLAQKEIEDIVDDFMEKYMTSLKQPAPKYQLFKSDVVNQLRILCEVASPVIHTSYRANTHPRDVIKQRIGDEYTLDTKTIQKESEAMVRKMTTRKSLNAPKLSFDNVQQSTIQAKLVFEKKIRETINKYEGGL